MLEELEKRGNKIVHHWDPNLVGEERIRRLQEELSCDVFLTSANALTIDGTIVNIDGTGNRVAGMAWTAGKIIYIIGINKVCAGGLEAAIARVKNFATPPNAIDVYKRQVPERADKAIVGGVARAYFTPLLNMGVNIYLYKGDILHAKTVTIDDRLAFLGTSNFDIRSFALDFEVDLIFYSETEVSHVLETQEMYIANSRILHRSDWEKKPAVEHVVYGITKLFSPLF